MKSRENSLVRNRVRKYMEEHQMILPGVHVLAGVSGGSDSAAMLHILAGFQEPMGFTLHVLHVNHGIRGEEAERDQRITQELSESLGVPYRAVKRPVPELSREWKTGEEEAGRRVRREAFEEEILRLGLSGQVRIALAHNQDDLAETVIHHLARGTGLRGIGSMRPCSGNLIRPVLCLTKEETIRYLSAEGILYAEDRTNAEDNYTRNRIRHYIMPALEKLVNPQASAHLAAAAGFCGEASDYLARRGRKLLSDCPRKAGGYLLEDHFRAADPVEKEYMVLAALEDLASARKDLEAVHVKAVLKLSEGGAGRGHLDLPYGIEAERTPEGILLAPAKETAPEAADDHQGGAFSERELRLSEEGAICETQYAGFCFRTRIFAFEGQNIEEKKYTKWFDYDKIKSGLHIRQKAPGDHMIVTESGVCKKLRRVMIDDKIPGPERETLPLVAEGKKIIWITGYRPCAQYRVSKETRRILEISCTSDGQGAAVSEEDKGERENQSHDQ